MNQIIFSNDDNLINDIHSNVIDTNLVLSKKKIITKNIFFKIIFSISSIISIFSIVYYIIFNYSINKKEALSQTLSNNFGIKTLYSSNETYETNLQVNNYVIGIIEIYSIGISYPIISESNDENLKISPCRFAGPLPNEIGNLCIVAHNYNNYKFFSQIYKLNNNDIISIYDLSGNKVDYYVYDKYEVYYYNLDCTNQDTNGCREITLITCNNAEDTKRIVIKAIEKG